VAPLGDRGLAPVRLARESARTGSVLEGSEKSSRPRLHVGRRREDEDLRLGWPRSTIECEDARTTFFCSAWRPRSP
jgi:hypothetical protein